MDKSTPNYHFRWDLSLFVDRFEFDNVLTSEDCAWRNFNNGILDEFLKDSKDF